MAEYNRWAILDPGWVPSRKLVRRPRQHSPAEAGAIRRNVSTRLCARCGAPMVDAQAVRLYCSETCNTLAYRERKAQAQVQAMGQVPCPLCETLLPVKIGYPKQQTVPCEGCGVVHKIRLAEDVEGILAAVQTGTGFKAYPRVQLPETEHV